MFEVEKKRSFEAGDIEVAEHLGKVAVVEGRDDLGINDDPPLHEDVGNKGADVVGIVVHGELFLLLASETLFGEFDDESTFVELFIEARLQREEYLVSGSDDLFSKVVGFHFFTTECTECSE